MSSVNNVDITSTQVLVDVRNQLDRYASPDSVEWHFVGIKTPWIRRALSSVGFGGPHDAKPVFLITEVGQSVDMPSEEDDKRWSKAQSAGVARVTDDGGEDGPRFNVPLHSVDHPWFHSDRESGSIASSCLLSIVPE